MNIMDATQGFAVLGDHSLIDCINPETGKSWINGETLEQIRQRYPTAEIVNIDEFFAAKEAAMIHPPAPITAERFEEMLNVLPPQRWKRFDGWETFEMCEHLSGNITAIFCRIGSDYFELTDRAGTPPETIRAKCRALFPAAE